MYIKHTYQDWLLTPEGERLELLAQIIASYKASDEYKAAAVADGYYTGEKTAVDGKYILKPQQVIYTEEGKERKCTQMAEVSGNRINCDFFRRFVVQRTHYSLANGVVIDGKPSEDVLGGGDHVFGGEGRAVGEGDVLAQLERPRLAVQVNGETCPDRHQAQIAGSCVVHEWS